MTLEEAKQRVLDIARSDIGYHEGWNNENKFADIPGMNQWYGWSLQNQPWCDVYYDSLMLRAFGLAKASTMTYQPIGQASAACRISALDYQQNNAYHTVPQIADQIFFYSNGAINHTGIVESITSSQITTIEGNSSDSVARRTYALHDSKIAGYGRPRWEVVVTQTQENKEPQKDETQTIPDKTPEIEQLESRELKKGDIVKIIGTTYYNGVSIPNWIRNKNWIVYQVNGDRVVINQSEDGTMAIMSPVNAVNLELVSDSKENTQNTSSTQSTPTETQTQTQAPTYQTYTVQKGDYLWKIASRFLGNGLRYKEIKELNNLKSDSIYVGQILKIPNS